MIFKDLLRFSLPLLLVVPAIAAEVAKDGNYILRPNDVVRIEVYGESDLSSDVPILKSGEGSFQLIGSVPLAGISVSDAAAKIKALYEKDYLVAPSLTLKVTEYATDFVSVIGSVKKAGQVPIPVSGRLDLASAMASAGGLAETADVNSIQLVRVSGQTSTFTQNSIQHEAARVQLSSGDRIIVNQSPFVGKTISILGYVGHAGPVQFPLNGKLDLITAISSAGGVTDMGQPKNITISRDGKQTVVDFTALSKNGGRKVMLQPDDVITVPQRVW